MTNALLLVLSAGLIAAGIALILRDVQRKGREAFLVRADRGRAGPDAEVTVAHLVSDPAPARGAAVPVAASDRAPEAALQWAALEPVIAAAVDQVNAVLLGAGVAIGAPGEATRSMMNRGFGSYRRILIGGESIAWLRLELGADGRLQASVKAHKDDLAVVNASSFAIAHGLDVVHASDLLSECLKPAASFAMRAANGASTEQWASETAWKEIDATVVAALRAANGALAQAGARLVPLTLPIWAEDVRRHRMTVTVEVMGADVARMHIERTGEEIEVAVGLPDARLAELGRRERTRLRGLTTHALAELIAGCAWPAIAHFRDAQHSV
jgi:hypothetical protein